VTPTQDTWEATTATADGRTLSITPPASKRALLVQVAGAHVGALYNVDGTLVIGRASDADLRVEGAGISRHHARVRLADQVVEFEDLGSTNGSFVNGQRVERRALVPGDRIQLGSGTVLRFGYQDEIDADFYRLMFESASRDSVTELCNQRFFMERLRTEFAFAVRHETPLLVIVFAVDGLRAIECSFGADEAQRVLAQLAKTALATLRSEDVVAHLGNGTFAILSRGIQLDAAHAIGERLRAQIAAQRLLIEAQPAPINLTFGSAGLPNQSLTTPEALLKMAQRSTTRS